MRKIIPLIFMMISSCTPAFATQITYPTTYATNGQVTNVNLNGNFTAASQVVNGKLDNTNADTTNGYRFYQSVAALPAAGNTGQVYYLTTDNSLNFDTGNSFIKTIAPSGSPVQGNVLIYGASGLVYTTTGTVGNVLVSGGAGTNPTFTTMPASNLTGLIGNVLPYIKITNTQANGVAGGTATSGSWLAVPVNATDQDTGSNVVSNSGGTFVLAAGTYDVYASQVFHVTNASQIRLQNTTAGTTLLYGQSVYATSTSNTIPTSVLTGRITVAASQSLQLQYRVGTTATTDGLGNANGFGSEVYTIITFYKVA